MTKVDLPDGGWLELRDPDDVSERQRRKITNIIGSLSPDARRFASTPASADQTAEERNIEAVAAVNEHDLEVFDRLNDLLAVALIVSWSLDQPVDVETLPDLPARIYRAVQAAVAPYVGQVMALDTSVSRDPTSPT